MNDIMTFDQQGFLNLVELFFFFAPLIEILGCMMCMPIKAFLISINTVAVVKYTLGLAKVVVLTKGLQ